MAALSRQPWCVATALVVPLLTLASPGWIKLDGVSPAWGILWLLPWALVDGRISGCLAGLALGLLLDGLQPTGASQIPALMLLGWWWGRIGRRNPPIQRSFNLALLALLGTLLLDASLMLQWMIHSWLDTLQVLVPLEGSASALATAEAGSNPVLLTLPGWQWGELDDAGLHILVAQTLLTAVLAPMLCSLQVLFWRQITTGWRE